MVLFAKIFIRFENSYLIIILNSYTVSSRLSNKSDKNLADFEDENSVDEEMLQLAQSQDIGVMLQHQQLASMASFCQQRQAITAPRLTVRQ